MRAKVRRIVEDSDTAAGRAFDLAVQALIIASLIAFCVQTLPDLSVETRWALRLFMVVTVGLFTVEYLLRLYVAGDRWAFVKSPYGLIDLFAVLPFYLALGVDMRPVRILRLFRLFQILKLLRYSRALRRYRRAFALIREELVVFAMAALFLIFLASLGIYYFERTVQPEHFGSIFHAMWWAVVTLTTVGYGDAVPVTAGGRLFTAVVLMIGIGIIAVPAGLLASGLNRALEEEKDQADPAAAEQSPGADRNRGTSDI